MLGVNKNKVLKTCCLATLLSCSGAALASAVDPLNIVGSYKCTGYDSNDGAFTGDLTFTPDQKASNFEHSFGAYKFKLDVLLGGEAATYSGIAAVQGQQLAMYFANDSKDAPTDRGVGMAVVSHDQNSKGQYTTTLHKSYYLPDYMGGGRGTETCVKAASS